MKSKSNLEELVNKTSVMLSLLLMMTLRTLESAAETPFSSYNDIAGDSQDIELRVAVEPGRHDCFYQSVRKDHNLDLSYQVIEITSRFNWLYSGSSDLTIDFIVKAPNGFEIFRENRKREGQYVYRATDQGIYAICLDNTFSSMSTKVVNLEVYVYSNEDDNDRWGPDSDFTFPPEVQYLDSVESIKSSINKVRDDMIRVTHEQEVRRAIETRDRNVAESNYDYVNRFSMVSIVVMTVVGLLQLYLIRSLFETKSLIRKVFKSY